MQERTVPAVLSIAGSDSSGGAGIQADIKTITAHRLFAETAITALTAQNTLGVRAVLDATPEFVAAQIDAVFEDHPACSGEDRHGLAGGHHRGHRRSPGELERPQRRGWTP